MNTKRIDIWEEGEYTYPAAYGFVPNIREYSHEDSGRDCILVVPGGAYCMVVPQEGEVVAKEFYNRGFDTFVLTYTTDITTAFPLKKQPLYDIARAVRVIREQKKAEHVYICGFSAGGHVCATLANHHADAVETNPKYKDYSARPDKVILSYPVTTCGEFTEPFSKLCLLGPEPTDEEVAYFSAECSVNENTPPVFIWTTRNDGLVPVQNTTLFADALRAAKIPCEEHIFSHGNHGMCLATQDFFDGNHGEPYTFEQVNLAVAAVKEGRSINVSDRRIEELKAQFDDSKPQPKFPRVDASMFKDIATWVDLAQMFLERTEFQW